jgi:hypothetical protein
VGHQLTSHATIAELGLDVDHREHGVVFPKERPAGIRR